MNSDWKVLSMNARFIGRNSVNRKLCSCFMCGNYRKNFGITNQEKIFKINWMEQIEDMT